MSQDKQFNGLELKIYDGETLLSRGSFEQAKIVVGRILSADFKVNHPKISRIHAIIELQDDGKIRLTDLASTHGTTVNGQKVVEKTISPQDNIQLAGLKLILAPLRPEETIFQEPITEQVKVAPKPAAAPNVNGQEPIRVSGEASQELSFSKDPTQIRSLKRTARARGVLDGVQSGNEVEVTVYWEDTILHVDHFSGNKDIFIGDQPGNKYIVASGTVGPRFRLMRVHGSSVDLNLQPSMKGSLRRGDKWESIEELQKTGQLQITLSGGDIAKIAVGRVHFFVMFVPKPLRTAMAPVFDQGVLFWGLQLSVALMAALALSFVFSIPTTIEGTVKEFPERLRKVIVESREKKIEKRIQRIEKAQTPEFNSEAGTNNPNAPKVTQTGGNEGEGAREKGAEGARGRPDAKSASGITNRPKMDRPTKTFDGAKKATKEPGKSATKTQAKATKTDVLESLKRSGLGLKIAQVTGGDGGGSGGAGAAGQDPLKEALSGVGGGQQSSKGPGGSGLQGTGSGGGGTAEGIGGLGTKGFGGGAKGDGVGSIPGKGDLIIGVEGSGAAVIGGLSREQIRRVVEAHSGEVRLCYEVALQRDPKLFGKVKMVWGIVGGGNVVNAQADENTTGSIQLANCITNRLRTWKFPSPPVGSRADVEWPFTFKPSN